MSKRVEFRAVGEPDTSILEYKVRVSSEGLVLSFSKRETDMCGEADEHPILLILHNGMCQLCEDVPEYLELELDPKHNDCIALYPPRAEEEATPLGKSGTTEKPDAGKYHID